MDEFLEQFLVESRELVQQATLDLLAVELDASDAAKLDGAFRSFHTLKGGAGIIEFPEMVTGLHAVEDLLASARNGARVLDAEDIGNCLWALDRITAWLDEIERTAAVPADAGPMAQEMVRRFQPASLKTDGIDRPSTPTNPDWLAGLATAYPHVMHQALAGLLFQPDPQCFFRGGDPLSLIAGLPGLLALRVDAVTPWQAIGDIDPFECNLRFAALSSASGSAIRLYLDAINPAPAMKVELRELSQTTTDGIELSETARQILDAQQRLLLHEETGMPGRVRSAHRVVVNILKRHGEYSDVLQGYEKRLLEEPGLQERENLQTLIDMALNRHDQDLEPVAELAAPLSAGNGAATVRSLRVSVERIDALVNLAGELSIAKNALAHAAALARGGTDPASLAVVLEEQQSRLERLVGQLHHSVMSIRVLPMRQVFQRFQRLVRDLAEETSKSVVLVTEGDETEADKNIVEALSEPILHVVRNAIDHGIEPVAERNMAGKPAQATIRMRAARLGDNIVVEVEDDGRGVDLARVREIASARGLTAGTGPISDAETLELLFKPGFSTSATVNTVSGRGVGMDAVRSAVESLGGSVDIESDTGRRTRVTFTLPYSILMTPLITVEAAGQIFGIALERVVETRRVAASDISTVGAARVFVHRGHAIPLVDLAATVGGSISRPSADDVQVVVTLIEKTMCGVEVDRIGEKMDILMRPVEGVLAGLEGIAGVTILGDGRVMLILDIEAMLA